MIKLQSSFSPVKTGENDHCKYFTLEGFTIIWIIERRVLPHAVAIKVIHLDDTVKF